jgi:hypothetical protein
MVKPPEKLIARRQPDLVFLVDPYSCHSEAADYTQGRANERQYVFHANRMLNFFSPGWKLRLRVHVPRLPWRMWNLCSTHTTLSSYCSSWHSSHADALVAENVENGACC